MRECDGTSSKMDFLPLGHVRTDPIINPTCLSGHVHTFYGAAASLRPETTYQDLVNAKGNSGTVEENMSLYWHPTIYAVNNGKYVRDPIWFASAYYVWVTGQTTAFPDGFKMVAGQGGEPLAQATAECVGPSPCEKSDCSKPTNSFFPRTACAELEMSMNFPSCWDGVNLDSPDHKSHVAYSLEDGRFDGDCPASHPVRIPQIQLYTRISNYDGGRHEFSDGTGHFHADYFSGWNSNFLQKVLDECSNDSDAASPDAFCEDFFTFRDGPKDGQKEDTNIVDELLPLQPDPPVDTKLITPEKINNVAQLPLGACTGTLLPSVPTQTPVPQPPTPFPTRFPTVEKDENDDDDDDDEEEENDICDKFSNRKKCRNRKGCVWNQREKHCYSKKNEDVCGRIKNVKKCRRRKGCLWDREEKHCHSEEEEEDDDDDGDGEGEEEEGEEEEDSGEDEEENEEEEEEEEDEEEEDDDKQCDSIFNPNKCKRTAGCRWISKRKRCFSNKNNQCKAISRPKTCNKKRGCRWNKKKKECQ